MKPIVYLGCPSAERPEAEKLLTAAGLSVIWADDVADASDELQRRDMPVLLDLSRGAAALQIAHDLRSHCTGSLMFAVIDTHRPDLTREAIVSGMVDVFARPLSGRRIANAIERELMYQSRQSRQPPEITVDNLYHHSRAMRDVVTLVMRAATMRAGVLIRGEDGTGRQVVARALHTAQGHVSGAFVTVDCAAFDNEHLDAELFGASARSQNGAAARHGLERVSRTSRLHDALGGTLYLQNVVEAPARVQARLARVLRDREALLVETGAAVAFDVRPIASVDPGVERAVQEERVRDDLFRRLSVICIDVPPLRNRREDIPALANYCLRELCGSMGIPPKTLSRPALLLISALPWYGNVVELRTLLENAVAGATGSSIELEDMLTHLRFDGGAVVRANDGTLRQARARFERDHIAAVLEKCQGRMSEAAKTLGIQRTNLYRKMRTLRINRERRR